VALKYALQDDGAGGIALVATIAEVDVGDGDAVRTVTVWVDAAHRATTAAVTPPSATMRTTRR
jgi:hypothetical protein